MSIICKKIVCLFMFAIICNTASATPSRTVLWLNAKVDFSTRKILENVSPSDGLPGSVIASPSRSAPDYYYHWVRDAALTMISLMNVYRTSDNVEIKNKIRQTLFDYLDFSMLTLQTARHPGEPKFYVDGSVYTKPWGRPQNDGPALRALSLIHFANLLIAEGNEEIVRNKLYSSALPATSPIKYDLEYISHHWKDPSYDIWEEVKGTHFYTLMVIRRALLEGASLASHFGDHGASKWYRLQAKEIEIELLNFWDEKNGYLVATINRTEGIDYKITNLDTSVLLGLLHGGMNDGFLAWDHPYVTATRKKIISAFSSLYPVNQRAGIPGLAIGRYPEDRYGGENFDGGNPWPICTLAVAESFYESANLLKQRGDSRTSIQLLNHADQFVERVRSHAYLDGSLDEQINRFTGYMTSARNLTWNYAALLTTQHAASSS